MQGLVGVVEEVGREAQDGIEVAVVAEDYLLLGLLVLAAYRLDEKGKEGD